MKIVLPNLPQNKVSLAVVGEEYTDIVLSLKSLEIEVLTVKSSKIYFDCEKSHADLRLNHLGSEDVVVLNEEKELISALSRYGFNVLKATKKQSGIYPDSSRLNACRIGGILLCNKKYTDDNIIKYAEQNNIVIIDTKQGYSRCATCIVSQNAVITSDISVYRSLKDKIDVLLISKGNITLGETDDGMIGGAAFMIDKQKIAFCGDISLHPDYIEIEAFLRKHNVSYISLVKGKLQDIGTAVILCERE